MENAHSYMTNTAPAVEGLFGLLNSYGWDNMQALVNFTKATTLDEFSMYKDEFLSTDVAREVIAGSILQIAYFAIKHYAVFSCKSQNTLHFESEMNRLISDNPNARTKKSFSLPKEFCVGRDIGHLPLGVVVYAARNQYNHFGEERLCVINEVVFNHLNNLWPSPPNGMSFNLYNEKHFYCYSVLDVIGWTDRTKSLGYASYKKDLSEMLQIKF